jgi:outer membrane receptor protein involved in Fe transport
MKRVLVTVYPWLSAVLILALLGSPAHAWNLFEPYLLQDPQMLRAPTEIERYLIIRGQEPEIQPLQPLDLGPRSRFDVPLRPALDLAFGEQRRPTDFNLQATSAPTDIAQTLQQPSTVQTTSIQRRSPVSQDPYVRGYGGARLHSIADGVYWTSARADMDSILNKADPSLVDQITVLPGPYGVRYGPGFAFIDIGMVQTPRYEGGFQAHNRMAWTFRFNGGQIYGTDTVYGGSDCYGFSLTYGQRVGSDYLAGNGLRIPSSYHVGNLMAQVGFDWGYDSRVEFRYQYVNEWDTEYAAQFFDVNSMVTNAFSIAYTKGQLDDVARIETNAWYYDTGYSGDTLNQSKRLDRFPVLQRVDEALARPKTYEQDGDVFATWYENFNGDTLGSLMATGARAALVLEPVEEIQTRIGTDFRMIDQTITENFNMVRRERTTAQDGTIVTDTTDDELFTTNLPKSTLVNPGLYAETTLQWLPYVTTSMGARFDWAYTAARNPVPPADDSSLQGELHRNEPLFAGYLTNTLGVTPNWTTQVGLGYAEVVPDLYQRYANGIFLGIIQNGFSRVIGTPALPKERLLQFDLELRADFEQFRGQGGFFHGWLSDHATYEANIIADPTGARLLRSVSTDRAAMTGFEAYAEYDWSPLVTPFVGVRYVRGQDLVIRQPLPQIAPLESTIGVRLEDIEASKPWGLEGGLRMVARQTRFASVRAMYTEGNVVPVELATPGFSTAYLRGFYRPGRNLNIIGGIENLFDRTYVEHLDLRLPAGQGFGETRVLSPGITPFVAVEWTL